MSVFGIASNFIFTHANQSLQSNSKQAQQAFQQLGQDLQSGNLSSAQSDFATFEQLVPQPGSPALAQANSNTASAVNQLSHDLQAGDLSAAQKDYSTLQANFQNPTAQTLSPGHRFGLASQAPQTNGIGNLNPQQTNDLVQQGMHRLLANIQSNYWQNSIPTGSSSLSVLG